MTSRYLRRERTHRIQRYPQPWTRSWRHPTVCMNRLRDAVKAARFSLRLLSGDSASRKGEAATKDPATLGRGSSMAAAPSPTRKIGASAPRVRRALSPTEAAEALGISRDSFDRHVKPEIRVIYR